MPSSAREPEVHLDLGDLDREEQIEINAMLQTVRKHMRRLESHSSELHGLRSGPQDFLLKNAGKVQDACVGAKNDANLLLAELNKLQWKLGGARRGPKPAKGRRKKAA